MGVRAVDAMHCPCACMPVRVCVVHAMFNVQLMAAQGLCAPACRGHRSRARCEACKEGGACMGICMGAGRGLGLGVGVYEGAEEALPGLRRMVLAWDRPRGSTWWRVALDSKARAPCRQDPFFASRRGGWTWRVACRLPFEGHSCGLQTARQG